MTDSEKLQLIQRVLDKAFNECETWRNEDHLGCNLAYLCHAISCPDPEVANVDWSDENADPAVINTRTMFREWFPPSDPVWQFIIT